MIDNVSASVVKVEGDMNIEAGDVGKSAGEMLAQVLDVISPNRHVKVAKAKSDARLNDAAVELAIKEMEQRAEHRRKVEELRFQYNMERIYEKAAALLGDAPQGKEPDEDWLSNFWDKARIVSNEEMQILWAKILAEEAVRPGKFSRRTVNLVADMDKNDAELFRKLCCFNWRIKDRIHQPLIVSNSKIYHENGIENHLLSHLDSIGLIRLGQVAFDEVNFDKSIKTEYFDKSAIIHLSKDQNLNVDLGVVSLTKSGLELADICASEPIPGFFQFILERWMILFSNVETEEPWGV